MSKLIKCPRTSDDVVIADKFKPFSEELGLLKIDFSSVWDRRKTEYKVLIGADELYELIQRAVRIHNAAIFPGGERLKLIKTSGDRS